MPVAPSAAARKGRRIREFGLVATCLALGDVSVAAAPSRPTDDATVLAIVPRSAVANQSDFRNLQKKLAANPSDLATAVEAARLAIRDGRANADLRSFGQAQAALGTWWTDAHAPAEARVLKAVILQNLHDYSGAEADLDAVLSAEPKNAEARLTRAFIRETTGALGPAKKDCEELPESVGVTATAICLARVEAMTGAAAQALERLSRAIATDDKADPAMRAWARSLAADAAAGLGETEEANRRFVEAITGSDHVPILVAYADFLLDAGRSDEVLTLLADRSEADTVLLRLAIAGKAVGDPRAKRWTELLDERFSADRANDVQIHKREQTRFELEIKGDASAALGSARANWKAQKEIADARLLLQASIAAGDPESATNVLAFIKANGLVDARLKPLQDKIAESK